MEAEGGGGRSVDVQVLLLLLPLVVAIPLLAYGGFLLYITAKQAAEHARREQAAAHESLQAALQRELEQTRQFLNIAAASPALREDGVDAASFASYAQRVVSAGLGIRTMAVLGRSGAVIVQYPPRVQGGRTAALAPRQGEIFETGKAVVSDLHESPLDGQLSVSIDVPVVRGGRVLWIVTALLDPVHLSEMLSAQVGPRDAMSTVLDSQRRIVARTRDLERWYGKLPSRETLQAVDSGERGWRRFRTLDGNAYLWTWTTIPTGWTVWLGSPAREFEDALLRSMLRLAAAGIGVLVLAIAATALLARRIANSADRMAENAHRLAEGDRPPYRPSGIRQLDELYLALEDASGEVSRALADRKRALDAERAARAIADEHNRSKDLFLGMLSHELRNPLAPIRSSIYVLKRANPVGDRASRARDIIERQTEHLTRIVDDLLDVTRIARGKILLHRDRVDLRELVRRAAEDARIALASKHVTLRAVLPGESLWADADATRITQVIGNLLSNATKFTSRGDEITVALRAAEATAEISVRDTGAGIDPELLPNVFDAFVQGKRTLARSEGGLGLGLALVKGLVELHGGSISARSEGVGKGAEFIVRLPVIGPLVNERPAHAAPSHAAKARHVLVVDDNADAAESLAELVRLFGHEVEVAYDGPSAMEKARRRRPDVVLCDIGLPGMDGYEVAQRLRSQHDGDLTLVAVSGYAQAEDVEKATAAGFDAHIAKPADPEKIEQLLA